VAKRGRRAAPAGRIVLPARTKTGWAITPAELARAAAHCRTLLIEEWARLKTPTAAERDFVAWLGARRDDVDAQTLWVFHMFFAFVGLRDDAAALQREHTRRQRRRAATESAAVRARRADAALAQYRDLRARGISARPALMQVAAACSISIGALRGRLKRARTRQRRN
jgi:hypothetical protein